MATRDVGTTQRPPSTALLTIDSEDRFANWVEKRAASIDPAAPNYSPYNFSLIRNASLVNGYMTRLAVSEVVFPWLYPNINDNTSLIQVTYTIGGGAPVTIIVAMDAGFYPPSRIASNIETNIDIQVPALGFSLSYGQDGLPRFSYSVSAGNTVAFAPLQYGQMYGTFLWTQNSNVKQLFDILGFTDDNITGKLAGKGQATLAQGVRYIDIVSPQLTANQGLPDATSQTIGNSALCRLYLGDANTPTQQGVNVSDADFTPPGCAPFVIYRQFSQPKQIQWNTIQPVNGRIQFQVLDDNGEVLPVSYGYTAGFEPYLNYTDWSLTLLLTEN